MATSQGTPITSTPWGGLAAIFIGSLLLISGLAAAKNFRGFTDRRVLKTFQLMRPIERPLSKVPPWKKALTRPSEERIRTQITMERRGGWLFAAAGALLVVIGAVAFTVWLV